MSLNSWLSPSALDRLKNSSVVRSLRLPETGQLPGKLAMVSCDPAHITWMVGPLYAPARPEHVATLLRGRILAAHLRWSMCMATPDPATGRLTGGYLGGLGWLAGCSKRLSDLRKHARHGST